LLLFVRCLDPFLLHFQSFSQNCEKKKLNFLLLEMAESFICANDLRKGHFILVDSKLAKVKEISRLELRVFFFFNLL